MRCFLKNHSLKQEIRSHLAVLTGVKRLFNAWMMTRSSQRRESSSSWQNADCWMEYRAGFQWSFRVAAEELGMSSGLKEYFSSLGRAVLQCSRWKVIKV